MNINELTELAHELTCACLSNAKVALHRNYDESEINSLTEEYKIEVLRCEQRNLETLIVKQTLEECTEKICSRLAYLSEILAEMK